MIRFRSLTSKLVFMGIIMLLFISIYIAASYIFTNNISDNATRINLAGSLRFRSFEMAWLIQRIIKTKQPDAKESLVWELKYEMDLYEKVAENIKNGNKELGIRALKNQKELEMLNKFIDEWRQDLKPLLLKLSELPEEKAGEVLGRYNLGIQSYAYVIDQFVGLLEAEHKKKLNEFNTFRFYAFGLFLIATVFIISYAKHNVIVPVNRLNKAVQAIQEGDFNVRVEIRSKDEVGELSGALNKMAEAINDREQERDILFRQASRSYEEWQNTFDSITDLISIHDNEFNIIRANRAFMQYFNLTEVDLITKKCYEVFHGGTSPVDKCPHLITVNEKRAVSEEFLDSKNNRILLVSTLPFSIPGAEFTGTIHIARDVTDEKEKERRLIMHERLAAIGQMASGIAHEINNPLASIAGCAEGLLNRVRKGQLDPVEFEAYLKIIEEEILRCKNITTSILSFARKPASEKKAKNVNKLLDKTLTVIGLQGRLKDVSVVKEYDENIPAVYAREGELRQVFIIIITNALDAMNDHGTIKITTGAAGGNVSVTIADTGPGIPPEYINKIYDPFFTTKAGMGGTGLGLTIANKIVSTLNGIIDVRSEKNKGTTFRITLPV